MDIEVRMTFGQRVQGSEGPNVTRRIKLEADGSNSILEVKQRVAVSIRFHIFDMTDYVKQQMDGMKHIVLA